MTTGRINQVAVIETIFRRMLPQNSPPHPLELPSQCHHHRQAQANTGFYTHAAQPHQQQQQSLLSNSCDRNVHIVLSHTCFKSSTTLFTPYFRHNQRQLSVAFLQKPHSTLPEDRKHTHTRCTHPPLRAKPCIPSSQQQYNSTHNPKGPHVLPHRRVSGQFPYY